jgi:hypothetical protein
MKVLRLLGAIFGTIGLGLLIGAAILYFNAQSFKESAVKAQGTVVDLVYVASSDGGGGYRPIVQFMTREGEQIEYESNTSSSPAAYDVGETVGIFYNPEDPGDAMIDGFLDAYLAPMILGGIGAVFFAVGGGLLLAQILGRRKRTRLMAAGRRVSARIEGVDLDTSLEVNGRHPYTITSQWLNPDTGELHVFRSDGIWFDPSAHLHSETIDVLIDPVNPKKYHVDTSFLPKVAE